MSQISAFGTAGSKQISGIAADEFATLTLTTAVAGNYKAGSLITGGTSGATARISSVVDPYTFRVKAVKVHPTTGAVFGNGEVINGFDAAGSALSSGTTAGSNAFARVKKITRTDSGAGTTLTTGNIQFIAAGQTITRASGSWYTDGIVPGSVLTVTAHATTADNQQYTVTSITSATVLVATAKAAIVDGASGSATVVANRSSLVFDTTTVDDMGFKQVHRDSQPEWKQGLRLALSKTQATDVSVAPVTAWTMPTAKTYSVAAGTLMRFTLTSNEVINVSGTPRIAIVDTGSAHTVYANYNPTASTDTTLVFDFTTAGTLAAGQIVSATYQANGATVVDAGTATTMTPAAMGSVTGILFGA